MLAGIGLVLIGGAMGLILWLVFPVRLVTGGRTRGASLVVSPLLAGLVLHHYGRWRESRGGVVSYTATVWGGALFAFGMANICYSGGWIVELGIRKWPAQADRFATLTLTWGVVFAVMLTLSPGVLIGAVGLFGLLGHLLGVVHSVRTESESAYRRRINSSV